MKRAVVYLRVSSPGQVQTDYDPEGLSIPAQRRKCLRRAKELGVAVVDEYVEPGRTATRIDKRPVFQQLLARIDKQRDVDCIIVYSLSRFVRNRLDSAVVLLSLRKLKVALVSATENVDDTPVGQLVHGMLDVVNEFRSTSEGQDIKYKMSQKALVGGTLTLAPIGYRNVREHYQGREIRTVAVDEERAPFIRLAFELYATGHYSIERLTETLATRGLRHRQTAKRPARPLSRQQLAKLLRNRYYTGHIQHEGIWRRGRHRPLVSDELFKRVQIVLDEHGGGERQRTYNHYLKGTLWCDRCQHRLIVQKTTNRHGQTYFYYFCRGRQDGACDQPYIPVETLEQAVVDYYITLDFPRDLAERLRDRLNQALERRLDSTVTLRAQLTKHLVELESREDNLLDLAADAAIPRDKLRAKLEAVQTERERCQRELEQLENEWEVGVQTLLLALELLDRPQESYRDAGSRLRRRLNQTIFEKLFVDGDKIVSEELCEPFDGLTYYRRTSVLYQHEHEESDPLAGAALSDVWSLPRAELLTSALSGRGSSNAALVEVRGLEPLASSVRGRRSTRLSYTPWKLFEPTTQGSADQLDGQLVPQSGEQRERLTSIRSSPLCRGTGTSSRAPATSR